MFFIRIIIIFIAFPLFSEVAISSINSDGKYLTTVNNLTWDVDYWYQSTAAKWEVGDTVKLYEPDGRWEIENITKKQTIYAKFNSATNSSLPKIESIEEDNTLIRLKSDSSFIDFKLNSLSDVYNKRFATGDLVYWIYNKKSSGYKYCLWNLTKATFISLAKCVKVEPISSSSSPNTFDLSRLTEMEEILGRQVKGQDEAVRKIGDAFYRRSLGIDEEPMVLLFAGPSGVGKTEMATALADLITTSEAQLIHLNFSLAGLQALVEVLPKAIERQPYTIIILEGIERVRYRSAFDLLTTLIESETCSHCIFILTANDENIFPAAEPVIFHPLSREVCSEIVSEWLDELAAKIEETKKITLTFDPGVHTYLIESGYSSERGMHSVKELLERKVGSYLSRAIIKEGIPEGSSVAIAYDAKNFEWIIEWE